MGEPDNQLRIDLKNTAAREGHRINVISEQDSLSGYRRIIMSGPYFTAAPYCGRIPSSCALDLDGHVRQVVNMRQHLAVCRWLLRNH